MVHGGLMKKLLASYGRGEEFRAIAEQITLEEEQKNNRVLARSLRHMLDNVTSTDVRSSRQPPSQKLASLIPFLDAASDFVERVEPAYPRKDIVLSHVNMHVFDGFPQEYRHFEEIRRHGLVARAKLLFCGPPGCGKALCVEVFAAELESPLFVIKLDRLISSYPGETAGNAREVFEFAKRQPCVLFPDELDALARPRGDSAEHNEPCRAVSSLSLFIDRMQPRGFMTAAANLDSSLDPAIWRWFDEVIWFDKPDQVLIKRFLNTKFKSVVINFDLDKYADRLEGYSFVEIERVCIQMIRTPLITRRKGIAESDFTAAIADESRRRAGCARLRTSQ